MTRCQSALVASVVLLVLAGLALPASAQSQKVHIPRAQTTLAAASVGAIHGVVLDTKGAALAGAMVSALGPTVAFALSGRDGRFSLDSLPTGAYTVRVHLDGYSPSRLQVVEVRGGPPAIVSVALQALTAGAPPGAPAVLTASLAPFDAAPAPVTAADGDHSHSDTAWRLRHLKRSVLKSVEDGVPASADDNAPAGEAGRFGRAFDSSVRLAASLFDSLPLTGQINVVTTGSFLGLDSADTSDAFTAASLAYVALGAPVGRFGQWTVRGAMQDGAVGSWYLSGTFTGRASRSHRYFAGAAYGTQQIEPLNLLGRAAIVSGSRAVGTVFAFDDWSLSRSLTLNYGLTYAWQDYLRTHALLSPRVSLTLAPSRQYRLRAVAARYATAPGADELLPSASQVDDGAWLPARRSFSAWSDRAGFQAQTTDHLELAVESVVRDFVLGLRTFYQRTDNQVGAIFAQPTLGRPAASLGHFYTASVGDPRTHGWAISVSRPIIRGLRGAVDYSQTSTRWGAVGDDAAAALWLPTTATERLHDLTTSLQTEIPQTATRLYVLYRLNTALIRQDTDDDAPALDSRFDVQLNQGLPFMSFTSADWEVLIAVRNLFRDPLGERSMFDELLVVSPPTRVVGGLRVRF